MNSNTSSLLYLVRQSCALLLLTLLALSAQAATPAPTPTQQRYEVRFLEDMIDHHAMGAMMANTCETKNIEPQLRGLCTDIRTMQQAEIATMQNWLESWYGVRHEPGMSTGDRRRMERLAALSGDAYEIVFMRSMTQHHTSAVRDSSACLLRAYHGDLVDLCMDMIETQVMEIRMMRTWLCQWHGICGPLRAD